MNTMARFRWSLLGPGLLLACALDSGEARAAPVDERAAKALLVLNIAKFVHWPEDDSSAHFVVGVLEPDPFGRTLDRLANGVRIAGRSVVIRRFAVPQDVGGCHVLFIGGEGRDVVRAALARSSRAVLTVSESPEFLGQGGLVWISTDAGRVRFRIDAAGTRRAGLRADAQLLKLGRSESEVD